MYSVYSVRRVQTRLDSKSGRGAYAYAFTTSVYVGEYVMPHVSDPCKKNRKFRACHVQGVVQCSAFLPWRGR